MQTQSLASLLQPTPDDVWRTFCAVRSFPTPMSDVMSSAQVPTLRFYGAIFKLEEDGLIVQHAATDTVVEWRLADA